MVEVVSVQEVVMILTRPVDIRRTVVEVEVAVADTTVVMVVSRVITKENKRYRHYFLFSFSSFSNFVCSRW